MHLDLPTIFLMIILTSLAVTVALMIVATGQEVPGLWSLAGAMLCTTAVYTLYSLYGRLPDTLTIALANSLIAVSCTLLLLAILALRGSHMHPLLVYGPPVIVLAASLLLLEDRTTRLILVNTLLLGQRVLVLWALVRDGGISVGRGRHILAACMVGALLIFGSRAFLVLLGGTVPDMLSSAVTTTVTNVGGYLAMVLTAMGFVLAAAEITADQNHRLALKDALTGLPNRRAILEELERAWATATRREQPLTALILDMDHFKRINDQHGHPGGDVVLRKVAEVLKSRLRGQDVAGRLGGEEFLVILPDTPPDGGQRLAETLRAEIAALTIDVLGKPLNITTSIGVYGTWPTPAETITEMIRKADNALYRAKAGGRNLVAIS